MANHDIQAPGFGGGFLNFHRDLIAEVLAWMRDTGHDLSAVQPWTAIPDELTAGPDLLLAEERGRAAYHKARLHLSGS
jgi:hypothetical protein